MDSQIQIMEAFDCFEIKQASSILVGLLLIFRCKNASPSLKSALCFAAIRTIAFRIQSWFIPIMKKCRYLKNNVINYSGWTWFDVYISQEEQNTPENESCLCKWMFALEHSRKASILKSSLMLNHQETYLKKYLLLILSY